MPELELESEYKQDLEIDVDNLDVELMTISFHVQKYRTLLAYAERNVKRLHEKVKTTRSELIMEINIDPDKHLGKGVKPKDTLVEAHYRTNNVYQRVKAQLHKAEFERDIYSVAVRSFYGKENSIKGLIQLFLADYFSGPNIPRNLKEIYQQRREQSEANIKDRMKKGRGGDTE